MSKKIISSLIFLLAIILFSFGWVYFKSQKFQIIFLNIGQGDSTLIKFSDSTNMLVDCGPDKAVLAKLGKYLPFYQRTIDYLLISHFDLDHYGGCIDVLKRYKVKNIIHNGLAKPNDKYWLAWDQTKKQEQAQEIVIDQPVNWQVAQTKLEFLSPQANLNLPADANNNSVILKLIHKDLSVMFVGDIEAKTENKLIEYYCQNQQVICPTLQAKILKVAHHGSDSSSLKEFLKAVSPVRATISVGKNKFGHPSPRVLNRLIRQGIKILRTDEVGDILISE